MDFEIPQDLCDGYGYPQLTDQAKRKILGENLLRLHGMDVEQTKSRLVGRNRTDPSTRMRGLDRRPAKTLPSSTLPSVGDRHIGSRP
jgi:hypothetical protein